uniref:Uncharacterized protein n=1 Tax=Anopheles farauti TaxID=69004 RepID=A0A182QHY5_9DIPT
METQQMDAGCHLAGLGRLVYGIFVRLRLPQLHPGFVHSVDKVRGEQVPWLLHLLIVLIDLVLRHAVAEAVQLTERIHSSAGRADTARDVRGWCDIARVAIAEEVTVTGARVTERTGIVLVVRIGVVVLLEVFLVGSIKRRQLATASTAKVLQLTVVQDQVAQEG